MVGTIFAVALLLAACSPTADKVQTEQFIEREVDTMTAGYVGEVSVDCEEPSSTGVGTTYDCHLDVDGTLTTWTVTIDDEDSYKVRCVAFIEGMVCPFAETDD